MSSRVTARAARSSLNDEKTPTSVHVRLCYADNVDDEIEVCCPYCFEWQSLYVDPQTRGELVQDCDVCCRPWRVLVSRDEQGRLQVALDRA